ncbi:hypothetical protein MGN70_005921 [Eutypa lata]|nr:hypothetical protein MGN70_005921 [Eutypa lata]
MNLGPKANDSLKQQQPTYHLAPNFTTRPSPNGPLDLGTIIEDIKQYYPINQGTANRVPVPPEKRYSDTKEGIKTSMKTSNSGEASILAKVLDRSIGGEASLKGQKTEQDEYNIQKLETLHQRVLAAPRCRGLSRDGKLQGAIYLITGLKIAWGATISTEGGRDYEGKAEGHVTAPTGPIDVTSQAKLGMAGDSAVSSSFSKPSDFVLGIQVQKIYHKKRFLSRERTLAIKRVYKGAVLVDNDEEDEEANAEDNFVIGSMDAELEGLTPCLGQDSKGQEEKWFIPVDVTQ